MGLGGLGGGGGVWGFEKLAQRIAWGMVSGGGGGRGGGASKSETFSSKKFKIA